MPRKITDAVSVGRQGVTVLSDGRPPVRSRKSRSATDPKAIGLDTPLYTLSVAAEVLETHPRTLMMYERLGLIEPRRTSTNRRR
ncbi:MAG: MerR family DNA-binding transcriptional regulator [Candidatus Dormibacteraceae bacterium]